jgi:glucose/arabinose dehydrogenase
MIFYTGDMFPEWKGNILIGGMAAKSLIRLVLDGDKVVAEERLLKDLNQRVREVQQGPDGALYILLDDGRLIRVSRK